MYETNRPHGAPVAATLKFVSVTLPHYWDGQRTVGVYDDEGTEAMMTVAPGLRRSLERAALLVPAGLCTRLDLDVDSSSLHVIGVYWEG